MWTLKSKITLCRLSCIRRCVLAIAGLILCGAFAHAEIELTGKALMVQKHGGEQHYYLLAGQPVITFDGDECKIVSDDFSATYPMYEIEYAKFVDKKSSGITENESSLVVDLSNPERVSIYGMQPGMAVSLYDLGGRMLRSVTSDSEGTAIISLDNLPKAVYIISSKATTFKLYRK